MKNENVWKFETLHRLRPLCGLVVEAAFMVGGLPSLASAQEAMGDTGCFWYENAAAARFRSHGWRARGSDCTHDEALVVQERSTHNPVMADCGARP